MSDGSYSRVRFTEKWKDHEQGDLAYMRDLIAHPVHHHQVMYVILTNGKQVPREVLEFC